MTETAKAFHWVACTRRQGEVTRRHKDPSITGQAPPPDPALSSSIRNEPPIQYPDVDGTIHQQRRADIRITDEAGHRTWFDVTIASPSYHTVLAHSATTDGHAAKFLQIRKTSLFIPAVLECGGRPGSQFQAYLQSLTENHALMEYHGGRDELLRLVAQLQERFDDDPSHPELSVHARLHSWSLACLS